MLTDILGELGQRKSEWRKIIMTQSRKLSQVTLFDGIFNFHVSTCAKLAYHPLLTATLSFLWYPHPHDFASFPSFLKKKITPPLYSSGIPLTPLRDVLFEWPLIVF